MLAGEKLKERKSAGTLLGGRGHVGIFCYRSPPVDLLLYGSFCLLQIRTVALNQSLVKSKRTTYSKVTQVQNNGRMLPLNPKVPLKHLEAHTHSPASPCQTRPVRETISQKEK